MSKIQRKCKWCGETFMARKADVRRGWAKYCSKRCKASHQARKIGIPIFIQKKIKSSYAN